MVESKGHGFGNALIARFLKPAEFERKLGELRLKAGVKWSLQFANVILKVQISMFERWSGMQSGCRICYRELMACSRRHPSEHPAPIGCGRFGPKWRRQSRLLNPFHLSQKIKSAGELESGQDRSAFNFLLEAEHIFGSSDATAAGGSAGKRRRTVVFTDPVPTPPAQKESNRAIPYRSRESLAIKNFSAKSRPKLSPPGPIGRGHVIA